MLLNEFDYIAQPADGVQAFIANYLNVSQSGQTPIDYPYFYCAEVNTGVPMDVDDGDAAIGDQAQTQGFGFFPGHYGMVLLSRFPIVPEGVRSFQHFLWRDMPSALRPIDPVTGKPWHSEAAWQVQRLSSKSHWVIPVTVDNALIYILASHPTPPVFDGPENRNGKRNHDEIRLWLDFLSDSGGDYLYDDAGSNAKLASNARFVVVGDLNASAVEGDAHRSAIAALLAHPKINDDKIPASLGGATHRPDNPNAKHHTASWGMRADYVLPSRCGFKVLETGVFWPLTSQPSHTWVASRSSCSDHRLVWVALQLAKAGAR